MVFGTVRPHFSGTLDARGKTQMVQGAQYPLIEECILNDTVIRNMIKVYSRIKPYCALRSKFLSGSSYCKGLNKYEYHGPTFPYTVPYASNRPQDAVGR